MITLLVWFGLGIIGAGFCNAYLKNEFKIIGSESQRRQDFGFAMMLALAGPVFLFVALVMTRGGRHGWDLTLKPPKEE